MPTVNWFWFIGFILLVMIVLRRFLLLVDNFKTNVPQKINSTNIKTKKRKKK